jgi:hypothetical protein
LAFKEKIKNCMKGWELLHGVARGIHGVSRANGFRVMKQDTPFEEEQGRERERGFICMLNRLPKNSAPSPSALSGDQHI